MTEACYKKLLAEIKSGHVRPPRTVIGLGLTPCIGTDEYQIISATNIRYAAIGGFITDRQLEEIMPYINFTISALPVQF